MYPTRFIWIATLQWDNLLGGLGQDNGGFKIAYAGGISVVSHSIFHQQLPVHLQRLHPHHSNQNLWILLILWLFLVSLLCWEIIMPYISNCRSHKHYNVSMDSVKLGACTYLYFCQIAIIWKLYVSVCDINVDAQRSESWFSEFSEKSSFVFLTPKWIHGWMFVEIGSIWVANSVGICNHKI